MAPRCLGGMRPLLVLALGVTLAGCTAGAHQTLDVQEWKDQLETTPDAFLLDVRTPDEYRQMHLANATLVPHTELERYADMLPADKDTPIFVYCRIGNRSGLASETLADMGYTDVRDLDGGILAWSGAGFPVEAA